MSSHRRDFCIQFFRDFTVAAAASAIAIRVAQEFGMMAALVQLPVLI